MISRSKRYNYDSKTLSFIEEKKWSKQRFFKNLTRFCLVNATAILLVFALNAFIASPEILVQYARIDRYNGRYELMNCKVDSLSGLLWSSLQSNDLIYRDVLQLDSVSSHIRSAGIGGQASSTSMFHTYSNEVYSKLIGSIQTLKRQLGIQEQSFDEILTAAHDHNLKIDHIPGIPPVRPDKNIWVTSAFGVRSDPIIRIKRFHKGMDFAGRINTNIFSTAEGVVTLVKHSRTGYGNEIVINHGYGYKTRYAHLNKILVQEGQKVKRGERIGLMGSTGRSTGTHLHYEVRLNNRPINPCHFYDDNLLPEEFDQLAKNL